MRLARIDAMAATVAALVSARPVTPVRDESAKAPKHPDTSQRKGLASSHFRRGFPRSPYLPKRRDEDREDL
jgi:hypothetical protein